VGFEKPLFSLQLTAAGEDEESSSADRGSGAALKGSEAVVGAGVDLLLGGGASLDVGGGCGAHGGEAEDEEDVGELHNCFLVVWSCWKCLLKGGRSGGWNVLDGCLKCWITEVLYTALSTSLRLRSSIVVMIVCLAA